MSETVTKRRFDAELRTLVDAEHLELLDELARDEQTTRADQVRKAIAEHLRRHRLLNAAQLTTEERVKALEFLADIQSRIVAGTAAA